MSKVIHMPAFNPTPYGLKEKAAESFAPAFTSVNGRNSMSPTNDQNSAATRGGAPTWSSVSRPLENGYQSSSSSASPTISSGETSPKSTNSNNKRRRSVSEDHHHTHSPESTSTSATRPQPIYQPTGPLSGLLTMENSQHRNLPLPAPPAPEAERRWVIHPREPSNASYQETQQHEARPTSSAHNDGPSTAHGSMGTMSDPNGHEETEVTRAGVHVELKKRKRVSFLQIKILIALIYNQSNSQTEPKLAVEHVEGGRRSVMKRSLNVGSSPFLFQVIFLI